MHIWHSLLPLSTTDQSATSRMVSGLSTVEMVSCEVVYVCLCVCGCGCVCEREMKMEIREEDKGERASVSCPAWTTHM